MKPKPCRNALFLGRCLAKLSSVQGSSYNSTSSGSSVLLLGVTQLEVGPDAGGQLGKARFSSEIAVLLKAEGATARGRVNLLPHGSRSWLHHSSPSIHNCAFAAYDTGAAASGTRLASSPLRLAYETRLLLPSSRGLHLSNPDFALESPVQDSPALFTEQEIPYPGTSSYSHSPLSFYDVTVEKYAELPHKSFTLKQLLHYGEQAQHDTSFMIRSARFVQREMPIRLAKRLMDLQFLPHIVVTNPHMMQVYQAYRKAFELLRLFPRVNTNEDNVLFTRLLTSLVDESAPLLDIIARGVRECYTRPLVGRALVLDSFLDNMLRSRISRRVMCEQHIGLQRPRPGFIGIICTELHVKEAVHKAATQCTDICFRTYGVSPRFTIRGDLDTSFPYIPAHLDYILFEIFKNASRAVVEHWMSRGPMVGRRVSSDALPTVAVTICKGKKDVTIKVSDQGGGIPEEALPLIWSYGYTTVDDTRSVSASVAGATLGENKSPMAGLGFGLPLSRVHAQYLGGDLNIVNIPDYGTDVYIRVHCLGNHAESFEI